MAATDPLYLDPPTQADLDAALNSWEAGRLRVDLDVDSPWYRVLRAESPAQALQYAAVCYPSDANNRFTPLYEADVVFPAAYAGGRRETALWEVVLRDIRHQGIRIVPEHQTRDRYLVAVKLTRRLAVLNLRRPQIENIVITGKRSPRLSAAPYYRYDQTRKWAQRLFDYVPDAEGFIYESHQLPGDCIVLFQNEPTRVFEPTGPAEPLRLDPVRSLLQREAARVGASVDFEEMPSIPDSPQAPHAHSNQK